MSEKNPFFNEEEPKKQEELSFHDCIELAKKAAKREVTKRLLSNIGRDWERLMKSFDDEEYVQKHFVKLIEEKLNHADKKE